MTDGTAEKGGPGCPRAAGPEKEISYRHNEAVAMCHPESRRECTLPSRIRTPLT
jgi:hypothetical protein